MKDIVRAAPDVESAWPDRLGTACSVEESTQDQYPTLEEIVWHPRCEPHAAEAVDNQAVHDGD